MPKLWNKPETRFKLRPREMTINCQSVLELLELRLYLMNYIFELRWFPFQLRLNKLWITLNNFESTLKYNSKGCTPYNLVDFSIFRFSFLFSFLCPTLLCQFFIIILRLSKRIALILAALISSLHYGRWRDGGK